MGIIFIDGFDKYGHAQQVPAASPLGFYSPALAAVMAGEWNSSNVANPPIHLENGLSATGQSFATESNVLQAINHVLGSNVARLSGGFRFKLSTLGNCNTHRIRFLDGGTIQAQISWENGTGRINVYNSAAAIVGTSAGGIAANTIHYLEWDITFADSGAYKIYLDSVEVLNSTADFKVTANAYATLIDIGSTGGNLTGLTTLYLDDLYLDDTGAVLRTNPAVETRQVASEATPTDFASGLAIFGDWELLISAASAPGANKTFVRKFTPSNSGSLSQVSGIPNATSVSAKFKAVCYADSAGAPGALLATGNEVTGTGTAAFNNILTSAFGSPPSLTGGTAYWIGFITDTSVSMNTTQSLTTSGVTNSRTYGSGPIDPFGTPTTGQVNWALWGTLTGVTDNSISLKQTLSFAYGDYNYVSSSTVTNEDLFNMDPLTATPSDIHMVALKGVFRNSDAGTRTVTLNTKSSGTDSGGTSFTPGGSYQWYSGYWATDPNGAIAWTKTNLNAATAGYKITA